MHITYHVSGMGSGGDSLQLKTGNWVVYLHPLYLKKNRLKSLFF